MLGVDYQSYLRYESGERGPKPPIMKLARIVSEKRLPEPEIIIEATPRVMVLTDKMEIPREDEFDDYLAVPLVEDRIAAGAGRVVRDEIRSLVWVYRPEVGRRRNLVAVQVGKKEKSMIPTIQPGAIVILDRDDRIIKKKGVYCVRTERETCAVKRVHKMNDTILLLSDNPEYLPMKAYTNDTDELIIGRVIWYWKSFL